MPGTIPENEPFIDEEKELSSRHGAKAGYGYWTLVMVALMSGNLSIILSSLWPRFFSTSYPPEAISIPGLTLPPFGSVSTIFTPDPIYTQTRSPETKQAWSKLIPNGRGFVSMSKLADLGVLPPDVLALDKEGKGQLSVSAFHQMHCLHYLVDSYQAAAGQHDHNVEHVHHCFEYLRHTIMCAADSTLEPWKEEIHGVDGFGTKRMCRDYGELFRWAEQYRVLDIDGV